MITPNYDNIDRWLFDYIEGNLSSEQESLLENYILNHPELEVDLDMWKMSNIKTSESFVNDIHLQKKTENRKVFALPKMISFLIKEFVSIGFKEISAIRFEASSKGSRAILWTS